MEFLFSGERGPRIAVGDGGKRSGGGMLPWLVGCTGALSIATGAIWLQKTSAVVF